MEQKASEDGNGKRRLQRHSNGKTDTLYLVIEKKPTTGK